MRKLLSIIIGLIVIPVVLGLGFTFVNDYINSQLIYHYIGEIIIISIVVIVWFITNPLKKE